MKHRLSTKAKLVICAVSAFLIVAGVLLYAAADRYLIEHVEVNLNENSSDNAGIEENVSDGASNTSSSSESSTTTATSYTSDTKNITISKVTNGFGSNQVTYYVADVQLTDATDLKSAFAKDEFGRNIIQYVSEIAENNSAILAINGDYYGFREDGIVIRNGVIYRDSPAREGLAIYKNGTMEVYDETTTTAQKLLDEGVYNTLSFGPALLENGEIISGIENLEIDTNFGNHSIQGTQPRTGIGIISDNHFVFIVVDGRDEGYSRGVTMMEFAQIFKDLGCTTAYNLDGGGSSEMWFRGKIINTPCNRNSSERGTSDILYIG